MSDKLIRFAEMLKEFKSKSNIETKLFIASIGDPQETIDLGEQQAGYWRTENGVLRMFRNKNKDWDFHGRELFSVDELKIFSSLL